MKINNPTHPGRILKQDILPQLNLTVTQAAAALRVSRSALSRLLNGRSALSAAMARRLGEWQGNGAEAWLRMQAAHDLWQAAHPPAPQAVPARSAGERPGLGTRSGDWGLGEQRKERSRDWGLGTRDWGNSEKSKEKA